MIEAILGPGDLPTLKITNAAATATVCLMGAHVLTYQPAGQEEMLFLSSKSEYSQTGAPIRGGVPICWPWFGPAESSGIPGAKGGHGFARQCMWTVETTHEESENSSTVVLALTDDEDTRAIWPYAFKLTMEVTVGDALTMKLTTTNTGTTAFSYAQALHTYFAVGEIEKTTVKGFDGLAFKNKVAGSEAPNPQPGDVTFTEETDRIYFHAAGESVIVDPVKKREIHITKENSDTGVVWNPWIVKAQRMADFADDEYHNMVCVECCNVDYDAPTLQPGEAHTMTAVHQIKQA